MAQSGIKRFVLRFFGKTVKNQDHTIPEVDEQQSPQVKPADHVHHINQPRMGLNMT